MVWIAEPWTPHIKIRSRIIVHPCFMLSYFDWILFSLGKYWNFCSQLSALYAFTVFICLFLKYRLLGPIYFSFHLSSFSFLEIKDCWYMMQVLLLMASALNLNMPIPESAADSVLQGMLKETRARQQCIAEITEMIHVCFWKTCYIFIVFFVLVLFYAFNS